MHRSSAEQSPVPESQERAQSPTREQHRPSHITEALLETCRPCRLLKEAAGRTKTARNAALSRPGPCPCPCPCPGPGPETTPGNYSTYFRLQQPIESTTTKPTVAEKDLNPTCPQQDTEKEKRKEKEKEKEIEEGQEVGKAHPTEEEVGNGKQPLQGQKKDRERRKEDVDKGRDVEREKGKERKVRRSKHCAAEKEQSKKMEKETDGGREETKMQGMEKDSSNKKKIVKKIDKENEHGNDKKKEAGKRRAQETEKELQSLSQHYNKDNIDTNNNDNQHYPVPGSNPNPIIHPIPTSNPNPHPNPHPHPHPVSNPNPNQKQKQKQTQDEGGREAKQEIGKKRDEHEHEHEHEPKGEKDKQLQADQATKREQLNISNKEIASCMDKDKDKSKPATSQIVAYTTHQQDKSTLKKLWEPEPNGRLSDKTSPTSLERDDERIKSAGRRSVEPRSTNKKLYNETAVLRRRSSWHSQGVALPTICETQKESASSSPSYLSQPVKSLNQCDSNPGSIKAYTQDPQVPFRNLVPKVQETGKSQLAIKAADKQPSGRAQGNRARTQPVLVSPASVGKPRTSGAPQHIQVNSKPLDSSVGPIDKKASAKRRWQDAVGTVEKVSAKRSKTEPVLHLASNTPVTMVALAPSNVTQNMELDNDTNLEKVATGLVDNIKSVDANVQELKATVTQLLGIVEQISSKAYATQDAATAAGLEHETRLKAEPQQPNAESLFTLLQRLIVPPVTKVAIEADKAAQDTESEAYIVVLSTKEIRELIRISE